MLTLHVITLFPHVIDSYMSESIMNRAQSAQKITVHTYNPRDYAAGKHKQVDDKAYGGGPGMVLMAEPILKAVDAAFQRIKKQPTRAGTRAGGESRIKGKTNHDSRFNTPDSTKVILLSPNGKQFTNTYAETLQQKYSDIVLISGRYEGIDARVKKILNNYKPISVSEISVGPYVLTGGELPALIVMDAVTRRLPGILGTDESIEERRVASSEMYTRPEVLEHEGRKYKVPDVLLSGHHKEIDKWRKSNQ